MNFNDLRATSRLWHDCHIIGVFKPIRTKFAESGTLIHSFWLSWLTALLAFSHVNQLEYFKMKTKIIAAAALMMTFAAPAMAWEGKVVACYDSQWVPAKYKATKHLHSKAHTKWEHRGDQLVEVYYAPVYIEKKTKVSSGHYVKRKAACRN